MKIIPSPPDRGERVRVRGVYFHGKKSSIFTISQEVEPHSREAVASCEGG